MEGTSTSPVDSSSETTLPSQRRIVGRKVVGDAPEPAIVATEPVVGTIYREDCTRRPPTPTRGCSTEEVRILGRDGLTARILTPERIAKAQAQAEQQAKEQARLAAEEQARLAEEAIISAETARLAKETIKRTLLRMSAEKILSKAIDEECKYILRSTDESGEESAKWRESVYSQLAALFQLESNEPHLVVDALFGLPELKTVDELAAIAPDFIVQEAKHFVWVGHTMRAKGSATFNFEKFQRDQISRKLGEMAIQEFAHMNMNINWNAKQLSELAIMLGCPANLIGVQQALLEFFKCSDLSEFSDLPSDWYKPEDDGSEYLDYESPVDLERIMAGKIILPKFLKTKIADLSGINVKGAKLQHGFESRN